MLLDKCSDINNRNWGNKRKWYRKGRVKRREEGELDTQKHIKVGMQSQKGTTGTLHGNIISHLGAILAPFHPLSTLCSSHEPSP